MDHLGRPWVDQLGRSWWITYRAPRHALDAGFPAARVYPRSVAESDLHRSEVRIAFDGDAVLFSDEAEQVYQHEGMAAFMAHETARAGDPLPPGPLKPFLAALQTLQRDSGGAKMKIRTALVTARSAPAHERAIRTLMAWNISVDEAMFLGGLDKAPFLREFEPDFFFDDQTRYCDTAALVAPTGHVASGIVNSVQDGSDGAPVRASITPANGNRAPP